MPARARASCRVRLRYTPPSVKGGSDMPVKRSRNIYIAATFVTLIAVLTAGQAFLERTAKADGKSVQAPRFEVDPLWPKPLPNHWRIGSTIGVSVDSQDHIWIIHRGGATL